MTNLTILENQVIKCISNADYFEDMPTDCIENIADNTGLSTKILRGVLSSLLQKGILMEGEFPNGMTAFSLRLEDEDIERNEFGDEFVGGCATCGKDVRKTDINGNCNKCK